MAGDKSDDDDEGILTSNELKHAGDRADRELAKRSDEDKKIDPTEHRGRDDD